MGGFFGAASNNDCITDVFFGTDYHSHLGTRRGGMTAYSPDRGFQRAIHSIENSPFRTKFEQGATDMLNIVYSYSVAVMTHAESICYRFRHLHIHCYLGIEIAAKHIMRTSVNRPDKCFKVESLHI